MAGRRPPRIAVVLQPRDRLDARGRPLSSVAIVALALARALAPRFEMVVAAPVSAAGELPEHTSEGIRLLAVPVPDARREKLLEAGEILRAPVVPRFAAADFHAGYWRAVADRLVGLDPDLVHVHAWAQGLPVLRDALGRTRFVLHLHDPHPALVPRSCLEPAMALADRILAVSDHLRDRLRSAFPELAARIETVSNGVDPGRWAVAESGGSGFRILQAGRISPEKGHHVLVRAFARVLARVPAAELHFVGRPGFLPWSMARRLADSAAMREALAYWGRGTAERIWRQLVVPRRAYLADLRALLPAAARARLQVTSALSHEQLPGLFARAALVAVPSVVDEPFGLPAVEAMAAGRAVVGSACGGIPACIRPEETGLLVPAGDDRALAEALHALLADPVRRREMGARGRRRAARFDWRRSAVRLAGVYAGLLGPAAARGPGR